MPQKRSRKTSKASKRRSPKKLRDLQSKYIREEYHAVARGDYTPKAGRKQIVAIGMSKGRAAYKRYLSRKRSRK